MSRLTRRLRLCVPVLLAALSLSTGASAWTDTLVESFRARVDARGEGPAKVEIELGIRIRGGWLEGLEITGLDPELVVSRDPRPVLYSAEGQPYFPAVEMASDGSLWIRFAKTKAPRRGTYTAKLTFESPAAAPRASQGKRRVEFTIPGFRSGLDGAEIELLVPKGARLPHDFKPTSTVRTSHESRPDGERYVFRRVHLPRTVSFTAALELPSGVGATTIVEGRSFGSLPEPTSPASPLPSPGAMALGVILMAWAVAARAAHRRASRRRGAVPKNLVGIESDLVHAALVAAAAGGMTFAFRAFPFVAAGLSLAILLVSLERLPKALTPPRPGRFTRAHARMLREAQKRVRRLWLEPIAFLDPFRPFGALLLVGAVTGVAYLELRVPVDLDAPFTPLHGLFVLVALALAFGRARLPRTIDERLVDVFREASRLTLPLDEKAPLAISLAVHLDQDESIQDVRIRVHTKDRPNGLLRLDVTSVDRAGLGGFAAEDVLLVVTRLGSAAELAVSQAFPDVPYQDAPGSRRARVLTLGAAHDPLIRAISSTAEKTPERLRERVAPLAARLA